MKRMITQSPVIQTVGKKLASENMKGRIFEANLGDLNNGYKANKKIKLIVEDADGKSKIALTKFYGLECTKDYLCSLIRKWHILIDLFIDCKSSEGFLMRFFVVTFTANEYKQKKAICYANRSQVKQMRAIMTKIITKVWKASTLKDLVGKVLGKELTNEMTQKCKHIFPLENVTIRKVKSIKRPRIYMAQLSQMQAETSIAGVELPKNEEKEAKE